MAINYLNSIHLNKNELIQAKIENQPNDAAAGTGVLGQLYFNTTDNQLRIWQVAVPATVPASEQWDSVSGDITNIFGGEYITITDPTGPIPTVSHDLTTRTDTTSTAAPAQEGTFTTVDSITTNTTGHVTALNLKTVTLPTPPTYTLPATGGVDYADITLTGANPTTTDAIRFSGDANGIVVTSSGGGAVDLDLASGAFGSGTGLILADGASLVSSPASGSNSLEIATTAFVQSATTGLLEFKGGFDANSGLLLPSTPGPAPQDLYTDIPLEVGDMYIVTAAGDFFGNTATPLTVGDSVIAQYAAAAGTAQESDFAVVQSDTDLATISTVGLGNVNAGTGIGVSYTSGTATVTNTDTNATNTATGVITAGQLSGTVTHALGINTIVQTIDSSGNTVFCDISRTATTSVATITVVEATDITILVQKIG